MKPLSSPIIEYRMLGVAEIVAGIAVAIVGMAVGRSEAAVLGLALIVVIPLAFHDAVPAGIIFGNGIALGGLSEWLRRWERQRCSNPPGAELALGPQWWGKVGPGSRHHGPSGLLCCVGCCTASAQFTVRT